MALAGLVLGACSDGSSSSGSLSATGPDATPDLDAAGSIDGFADEADAGAVEDGEVDAGDASSAQDVVDVGTADDVGADMADAGGAADSGTPDANPDADLDSATEPDVVDDADVVDAGPDVSIDADAAEPDVGEDIDAGPDACVPSCSGVACGDDGCGGSCGGCGFNEVCVDSVCADSCEFDIQCEAEFVCLDGHCAYPDGCVPSCSGIICGDDGCGGSCGDCGGWGVCTPEGACKECLAHADCEDGSVFSGPDATWCSVDGACVECEGDAQCDGAEPFCFEQECVECLNNADCGDGLLCNADGACVECVVDAQCGEAEPICFNHACVECEDDGDCEAGFVCAGVTKTCEVKTYGFTTLVGWSDPHVVRGHIVDLSIAVDNGDFDGDGAPDPYFTEADCYEGNPEGCGINLVEVAPTEFLWKEDPAPNLYEVAVHVEPGEWPGVLIDVEVHVEFDEDGFNEDGILVHVELELNQTLSEGDLWCAVIVDPVAKTLTPCVDGDGDPKVTPGYPIPGE